MIGTQDFIRAREVLESGNIIAFEIDGEGDERKTGFVVAALYDDGATLHGKKRGRGEFNGFKLQRTSNGETIETITKDQSKKFIEAFGPSYSYGSTDYRNCMDLDLWQAAYDVQDAQFTQYIKATDSKVPIMKPSTVCRGRCQLVLPVKSMTIDHQRPQKGGQYKAISRVFRGLGLTKEGPRGVKNRAAIARFAADLGGTVHPAPTAKRNARNELSDAGVIYYSILKKIDLAGLKSACMHHYLNLAPMCSNCNSSKGNR